MIQDWLVVGSFRLAQMNNILTANLIKILLSKLTRSQHSDAEDFLWLLFPIAKQFWKSKLFHEFQSVYVTSRSKIYFFKKWAIPGLFFFIFFFSILLTVNVQYKMLPMTRFELGTSVFGSNCSTNWATTTTPFNSFLQSLKIDKTFWQSQ